MDYANQISQQTNQQAGQSFLRLSKLYINALYQRPEKNGKVNNKHLNQMRIELRKLKAALQE